MEAAKYSLFTKGHKRSAESPETAHDGERDDGTEEESDDLRLPFGEDTSVEKEKAEGHDHAEEEEHLVAKREADAHSREGQKMFQSRSLLPVSSMKTSS